MASEQERAALKAELLCEIHAEQAKADRAKRVETIEREIGGRRQWREIVGYVSAGAAGLNTLSLIFGTVSNVQIFWVYVAAAICGLGYLELGREIGRLKIEFHMHLRLMRSDGEELSHFQQLEMERAD